MCLNFSNNGTLLKRRGANTVGVFIAATLWLSYLFEPGLKWIVSAAFRSNPVRSGHVEAIVPRTWLVLGVGDNLVAAANGCLTRFCSQSSQIQTIGISWAPGLRQLASPLKVATISDLEADGFSERVVRSLAGAVGDIQCIEGRKGRPTSSAKSFCFAYQADLQGMFEGNPADLDTFYRIVKSARIR